MNDLSHCQPVTRALHQKIDDSAVRPLVTPLYQNSAFTADSPYFYSRKNNPNCAELEYALGALEGASHVISVTTGMAAISMVMGLIRPGDRVVVNKDVYGCSYKFFQREAARLGIRISVLDLSKPVTIAEMPEDAAMVFFETPTNPFLKTIDIEAVSRQAKKNNSGALVMVDNTWATPFFQKPLQHGADISLYSATKFISGHSDVMGGLIAIDDADLAEYIRAERFYSGAVLDPHSAWLLRRSLQTFALRMQAHQTVTLEMKQFLETLPEIETVYYPDIDGRQLSGYGCILFFDLRPDLVDSYPAFAESLQLFSTGTGMACVTSMVAQPYTGSHASMSEAEKAEMGLGRQLVRLCFGLEDVDDLKKDLTQAFALISDLEA